MKRQMQTSDRETRVLEQALKAMGAGKAPASLLPAVLRRVGLADLYWSLESPIGRLYVAYSRAGISMVNRAKSARAFEREFERLRGRTIRASRRPAPAPVAALVGNVKRGHRGKLKYDLRGLSPFERAVLLKALEIPTGEVRPYSWIAREIGHPEAVRATGSALAKNPIPLLIPCHRVVRTDGHIGRYSLGGPRVKRALLGIEGAHPERLEELAAAGVRYLGNEKSHFYCFPTCGGFDSLVKSNRIPFGSERDALAAGYHPCEVCRPAA